MNSEELKKEFGLLMPSEINGFKRPDESISSSNDFFLEIPQLISKDPVLYSTMNLIFSVILSNDKLLKQWIDTLQNVVNAQDWRIVTDTLKGYMTPELKKKLDGIATGANNYVHPNSHPASMIAQDATHRFVSDTEKNTWNGKASTSLVSTTANGLMPKRDGSATSIFTGDGVWKSLAWDLITGKPSTFAPSAHNHDSSYLKRNQTTQNDMNACTVEGIYRFSGTLSNAWTGTSWGTLLVLNNQYNGGSGVSGTFLVQIALPTDGRMWTRQRVNTGAWTSWVRVAITTDNVASATKATQDSRGQQIDTTYIKEVTGSNATLTVTKGNGTTSTTTINNVANATNAKIVSNTAEDGSATDLVTGIMASNDYFRIRIGGSSDVGYAEIATADNGNEPIYIRQYQCEGSNFGFSDLVRTATILDESGNTSFPGTVTAPNFNGKATKATQDSDGNAINTTYLKRSGGTMGGALNLANNTLNLAGDDCYFGDQNIAGGFCLKGANGTTNLTFINKDNTTQMASLSYAGVEIISSVNIKVPKIVFSNGSELWIE